jgi:preprotein translocase subunit YajC
MKMKKLSSLKSLLLAPVALVSSAFAGVTVPAAEPQGPNYQMFILLIVFVAIFYFFMIRPQMKRQKEQRALISQLSRGDEVVTNAGIYGVIDTVSDTSIQLKIADGVVIRLQKQAVVNVLPKGSI